MKINKVNYEFFQSDIFNLIEIDLGDDLESLK